MVYLGYYGAWQADCVVSEWGEWTGCSQTCYSATNLPKANGGLRGMQTRYRQVLQGGEGTQHQARRRRLFWTGGDGGSGGGSGSGMHGHTPPVRGFTGASAHGYKPCPALSETRQCDTANCPIDCQVGNWDAWGPPCDVSSAITSSGQCDGSKQQQSRRREITRPSYYGGRDCGVLVQTRGCWQDEYATKGGSSNGVKSKFKYPTRSCVGRGPSRLCGGSTRPHTKRSGGKSDNGWQIFTEMDIQGGAIYTDVDTSQCMFGAVNVKAEVPQYVIALGNVDTYDPRYHYHEKSASGNSNNHNDNSLIQSEESGGHYHGPGITGGASVSIPTATGFRVILTAARAAHSHSSVRHSSAELLEAAVRESWYVSWAADSGTNVGLTVARATNWRQVDVDGDSSTSSAGNGNGMARLRACKKCVLYADIDSRRNQVHVYVFT